MKVIKHDGRQENFDENKIVVAVNKACTAVGSELIGENIAKKVCNNFSGTHPVEVDCIHNTVERCLMLEYPKVAKAYILFRQERTEKRELGSELNQEIAEIYHEMNHDNANTGNCAASKMYGIAEKATKRFNLATMNPVYARNHKLGRIYIHDLGYRNLTINCFFNPLSKMLEGGFDNGVGYLRQPKSIGAAGALAAILLQSCQNDFFGGQGFLNFDTDLAPYVKMEYKKQEEAIIDSLEKCAVAYSEGDVADLAKKRTEKATYQAMEAFIANMNTMRSRSGAQVTFSSVNFGTDTNPWARMISKNLFKAYIAGLGKGENPIFPNLCYRVKKGINLSPEDPNFDITELAIECVGKRIQPRFVFCDSPAYKGLPVNMIGTMGCRTAVRSNVNGDKSPDARGNIAFNTINLPMLALEAVQTDGDNLTEFKAILRKAVDDAIDELLERWEIVRHLKVKDIPFASMWYQGHEGLKPDDEIGPMIQNGTLSVGFIGLAECLKALIGEHHGESEKAQKLGLDIIGYIRQRTDDATKRFHLNFSTFATPAESACYTLLRKTVDRFGVVKDITDKDYFTNSFHLPVSFETDAKTKIDKEGPYHLLCNAGAIMYVEAGNTTKYNPLGVLALIRYMNDSGAVYGGINWEHDYCIDCGYQGTFQGACPHCKSKNVKVTKVITGYMSETWRFNKGKQAEAADRTSHTGGSL